MPTAPETTGIDEQERLDSWKVIAAYLGCGERTAKRWEKTRGLPVRRLPGGKGQVFTFRREVDLWRTKVGPLAVDADDTLNPLDEALEQSGDAYLASHPDDARVSAASAAPVRPMPDASARAAQRGWLLLGGGSALLGLVAAVGGLALWKHAAPRTTAVAAQHVPPQAARNLYLTGRFYWNKRTPADLELARSDFEAAASLDPQYAAAYAGIADCYALSPEFAGMNPSQAYPQMLQAAGRALQLDPDLPEAHRALGFALFYWNWDRAGSVREFERAIQLNSHDATTYHWYANVLAQAERASDALPLMEKARELEPASPSILADHGLLLMDLGRATEALAVWTAMERSDPAYLPPHRYTADWARRERDGTTYLREMAAIATLTHAPADAERLRADKAALRQGGFRGLLNTEADNDEQQTLRSGEGAFYTALALDEASRKSEALDFLELAYKRREPTFPLVAGTLLDDLNGDRRFAILKKQSLLPYPEGS